MKLCAALLVTLTVTASSHAQSYRRFELSSQTTMVRIAAYTSSCGGCPPPKWMIGPEVAFNLNQHFAIDGALSWSPFSTRYGATYGGRLVLAAFGDPKTFNPITENESSSREIIRLLFSSLVHFDWPSAIANLAFLNLNGIVKLAHHAAFRLGIEIARAEKVAGARLNIVGLNAPRFARLRAGTAGEGH